MSKVKQLKFISVILIRQYENERYYIVDTMVASSWTPARLFIDVCDN